MGKNKAAINIGKSCRVAHSGRLSNQEKYLATADVLRPRILHRGLYRPADIYSKGVRSSWISVKETSGVRAGMPLLPLSQAPTVCTSFDRWFRAALSPLLLGFQSVPLAFHHWDRHLVISCIPEQASIASPPRHPTRRTNRTLKNGLDMVPPRCSSASPDTRQFRGRFWCTNTPRWEKARTRLRFRDDWQG